MTKIWGKILQRCLRIVWGCHSLVMKHVKLPSTLVLEGMCRLCIILRCQMFRKTLLWKSQLINNLFSHHICYMYLKYVQYFLKKEQEHFQMVLNVCWKGWEPLKVWALFFFFYWKREKGGNGGTSLQLNELMSTGCTDALQQFSSFYIHFFEKLHLAVCFQKRESPVLRWTFWKHRAVC